MVGYTFSPKKKANLLSNGLLRSTLKVHYLSIGLKDGIPDLPVSLIWHKRLDHN